MKNILRIIKDTVKAKDGVLNLEVEAFMNSYEKEKEGVLIDVRRPDELAQGKIAGAININYTDDGFTSKINELDKNKSYYVYCRSGKRSLNACKSMKGAGIEKVVNMEGGFLAWSNFTSKP